MTTESADPRFVDLDGWPLAAAVAAMAEGQARAVAALDTALPALTAAATAGAARLSRGGRIAYAGAGTSGRLAVQDGVELTPTFDWPDDRLVFLLAGGAAAMMRGIEGAEDDTDAAVAAVTAAALGVDDVLVAVAASGRTPYTRAAVASARAAGALTIAIANNPAAPLLADAEHAIALDTGAEVVAGSTRMQAGTAQKAALNILSTAMMLRLGLVYRGRMVAMRATNAKLRARAVAMVADLAGVDAGAAQVALLATAWSVRAAVLVAGGATREEAQARLDRASGNLRQALG